MGLQTFKSCCTCKYISACCSTCHTHTHRHIHTRTFIFIFFICLSSEFHILFNHIYKQYRAAYLNRGDYNLFFLNVMSCINVACFPPIHAVEKAGGGNIEARACFSYSLSFRVCICLSVSLFIFIHIYFSIVQSKI